MPKKNLLFDFIKFIKLNDQHSKLEFYFENKGHGENEFYIHHLKDDCAILFYHEELNLELTLNKHHLSVYKRETILKKDNKDNLRSPGHYTAIFKDQDDQEYRLHVYFGKEGNVLNVVFEIKNKDGFYQEIGVDQTLKEQFTQQANDHGLSVMTEIWKQYKQFIAGKVQYYQAIEKKITALSVRLDENIDTYLKYNQEAIKVLKLLAQYEVRYYNLLQIYERAHNIVQKSQAPSSKPEQIQDTIGITTDDVSDEDTFELEEKHLPVSPLYLASLIKEAFDFKKDLDGLSVDNKLDPLLKFIPQVQKIVQETFILYDDHYYIVMANDIPLVETLLYASHDAIKEVLESLLSKDNIEDALKLDKYVYLLPPNKVVSAIEEGKIGVLKFLLPRVNYKIEDYCIDDQHQSIVLYCFENNKADCLSELVKKYGQDILFVKAGDGCPIAYHILKEPNHSLQNIIINNSDSFNKFLNSLTVQIQGMSDDIINKEEALTVIKFYKSSYNKSNTVPQAFTQAGKAISQEQMTLAFAEMVSTYKGGAGQEIHDLWKKFLRRIKELPEPPKQHHDRHVNQDKRVKKYIEQFKKIKQSIEENNQSLLLPPPGIMHAQLEQAIEFIELLNNCMTLSHKGKKNKNRLNKIVSQISEREKEYTAILNFICENTGCINEVVEDGSYEVTEIEVIRERSCKITVDDYKEGLSTTRIMKELEKKLGLILPDGFELDMVYADGVAEALEERKRLQALAETKDDTSQPNESDKFNDSSRLAMKFGAGPC